LIRISPESATRAADIFYPQKSTSVLLEGVGPRELARFLDAMRNGPTAKDVHSICLTASREQESTDQRTAEVTVDCSKKSSANPLGRKMRSTNVRAWCRNLEVFIRITE
jgi:hypothetical protein